MVMLVKENPLVAEVEALDKCRRVMELICEKCIKQQDMNEVLAMKMHYISCVLGKCASFLREREDKLDGLIKRSGPCPPSCPRVLSCLLGCYLSGVSSAEPEQREKF